MNTPANRTEEVRIMKLITGEEVLSLVRYPDDDENFYTFIDPVVIVLQQGPKGLGVTLIPYAVGVDGDIHINTKHVIYDEKPKDDLADRYREVTTGITVAKKELVMPT